jgi:hypothetical protein
MPHEVLDSPSLRHIPSDVSDESVSFQIPSQADSSNLLDDAEGDFFGVPNQAIDTPLPHYHKFGLDDLMPNTQRQPSRMDQGPFFERDLSRPLVKRLERVKFYFNADIGESAIEQVPSQKPQPSPPIVLAPSAKEAATILLDRTNASLSHATRKDLRVDVDPSSSSRPLAIERKEPPKSVTRSSSTVSSLRTVKHTSYDNPKESLKLPPKKDPAEPINLKTKHVREHRA